MQKQTTNPIEEKIMESVDVWAMNQLVILIKNSEVVFDIFYQLAERFNQTLLIVTHDQSFADRTHFIVEM